MSRRMSTSRRPAGRAATAAPSSANVSRPTTADSVSVDAAGSNPPLAHRALEADPSVGALLPCNVVLRADGTEAIVEAMDPLAVLGIVEDPAIKPIAEEAKARLERAIATLGVDR